MKVGKLLFLLGLLCAVMALIYFLTGEEHYADFPPTAAGPWVAFGDSLTEGFGATEGNSYPALLARELGRPILNYGKSGATTADGLSRLDTIIHLHPRVVLLCLGGNDSFQQEPPEQTFSNLAAIIDRLHEAGTFVVLIGIRSASLRDKNEPRFRQLARATKVFYVHDMLRGIAFKPVYMSDAIHPNDDGYKQIAQRLEKALRPLLPKLADTAHP